TDSYSRLRLPCCREYGDFYAKSASVRSDLVVKPWHGRGGSGPRTVEKGSWRCRRNVSSDSGDARKAPRSGEFAIPPGDGTSRKARRNAMNVAKATSVTQA